MVKIGDKLIRIIGHPDGISMAVIVQSIDEKRGIFKVGVDEPPHIQREKMAAVQRRLRMPVEKDMELPFWEFNIKTGAEVDEEIGWDGLHITGSYIKDYPGE